MLKTDPYIEIRKINVSARIKFSGLTERNPIVNPFRRVPFTYITVSRIGKGQTKKKSREQMTVSKFGIVDNRPIDSPKSIDSMCICRFQRGRPTENSNGLIERTRNVRIFGINGY